jgi:photosystem II stability/assembly factor-like uncharacterized protein
MPLLLTLLLLLAPLAVPADEPEKADKGPFARLDFRFVGPVIGGRATRATGVPGDPRTFYVATAGGGIWKSTNGGHAWEPIFDDQPVSSVGSIAVAPSDPAVIYAGTGEANIRGNVAAGAGIFKSTDAGKTWTHVWKQAGQIGTMAVHPTNPDIAFAAVLGHVFGPNPERGVYRTTDGGRTWRQVLKKDVDTGASDVAIDRLNPRVVFAGLWQARRRPWELTSGGPGSGLHVSRDGGETWKELTGGGLPRGVWGKVGVAVAPSDSSRVYALIEADAGGLFRSDDGGESWERASAHRALRQRAWYYTTLTVDPRNPDVVWAPQVPMLKSIDGGRTFRKVKLAYHGDNHDVWIDPLDPSRMTVANDGGINLSVDGGKTFFAPRLPIGQCYHVATDSSTPYRVSCALQDMGTASAPSNTLSSDGITIGDWEDVGGGEAGHTVHDPADPNVVYAGEYLGYISRWDRRTRQSRHVGAWPDDTSGRDPAEHRYRFQWTAPILASPHDPKTVYHGGNVLFRTTDAGQSWTAISPDLSRNDKTKQQWSGGPITGDNTGVEHYGTIFALAESPREKGLLWAGTDDGLVHLTRDGGANWTNVTAGLRGLPEWATVSIIEPSPHDAATAYLVADAHRLDDARPYLWKTADHGRTWKPLTAGLPADVYLHAVREDPKRRGQLYLATERGLMFSRDDGGTWLPVRANLPTVAVHDLVVKDDALVIGTHGRSIWILDDLAPLRAWAADVLAAPVHLFTPPPVVDWRYASVSGEGTGENPADGVVVYYHLKDKPKGDVTVEVRDAAGALVRTLSSKEEELEMPVDDPDSPRSKAKKPPFTAVKGLNRGVWDLAHAAADKIPRARVDWGNPETGPSVLPGTYSLKVTVDGRSASTPIEVRPDPRVVMTPAERAEQHAFGLEVRDAISRLTRTVVALRSVRKQLETRREAMGSRDETWHTQAGALLGRLDALEGRLHNPRAEVTYDILAQKGGAQLYSRLLSLQSFVQDGDGVPTKGMRDLFAELRQQLESLEGEWKLLMAKDLPAVAQGPVVVF